MRESLRHNPVAGLAKPSISLRRQNLKEARDEPRLFEKWNTFFPLGSTPSYRLSGLGAK
jgi:hypothetical protein